MPDFSNFMMIFNTEIYLISRAIFDFSACEHYILNLRVEKITDSTKSTLLFIIGIDLISFKEYPCC